MIHVFNNIISVLIFIAIVLSCGKRNNSSNCDLSPDSGPCEAAMKRYYFDQSENKCKEFTYGGCDGLVPFNSMEECECECNK